MEWYTGDGKKKPTLAKKESVQVSIQDNHTGKGASRKLEQLKPEWSEE